jgi:hypothetical protein
MTPRCMSPIVCRASDAGHRALGTVIRGRRLKPYTVSDLGVAPSGMFSTGLPPDI